jgi:hypothetical protein
MTEVYIQLEHMIHYSGYYINNFSIILNWFPIISPSIKPLCFFSLLLIHDTLAIKLLSFDELESYVVLRCYPFSHMSKHT